MYDIFLLYKTKTTANVENKYSSFRSYFLATLDYCKLADVYNNIGNCMASVSFRVLS